MTTVVVDKGYAGAVDDEVTSAEPEDEHEEEHEEGEEPVTLGSLEVHPR